MGLVITCPEVKAIKGPLIFLAGPIQGAFDWQAEAIDILKNHAVHVASPRRTGTHEGDFTEDDYHTQIAWEHDHIDRAAKNGVVLFWLAKPERLSFRMWLKVLLTCRPTRPHAQTSRFELGEAVALHYLTGVKVVIGIEPGFSNEKYIRRTILKKAPNIPILNMLKNTCKTAYKLATQ